MATQNNYLLVYILDNIALPIFVGKKTSTLPNAIKTLNLFILKNHPHNIHEKSLQQTQEQKRIQVLFLTLTISLEILINGY